MAKQEEETTTRRTTETPDPQSITPHMPSPGEDAAVEATEDAEKDDKKD